MKNLVTYRSCSLLPTPITARVWNPPEVPVAAILPRSNANEFALNPVDLKA